MSVNKNIQTSTELLNLSGMLDRVYVQGGLWEPTSVNFFVKKYFFYQICLLNYIINLVCVIL